MSVYLRMEGATKYIPISCADIEIILFKKEEEGNN
jgi:hypothetical protein